MRPLQLNMMGGWTTVLPEDARACFNYLCDHVPINWRPWPLGMVADLTKIGPYVAGETMAAPQAGAIANAMMGIIGGAVTLGTIASVATVQGIVAWLMASLEPAADSAGEVDGCTRRFQHQVAKSLARRWPMLGIRTLADGRTENPGRALCVRQQIGVEDTPPNFTLENVPQEACLLLDDPKRLVEACGPGAHWSLVCAPPAFICAAIEAQL